MTQAPAGVRLIVAYKALKGLLELTLGGLLLTTGSHRLADLLRDTTRISHFPLANAWGSALTAHLLTPETGHALQWLAASLLLDGVFSLFEGYALMRRFCWSHWLVVLSTASLLPLECVALLRHASALRGLVLLVNLLIVTYLVQRIRHQPMPGPRGG